jgi:hypothetical protein
MVIATWGGTPDNKGISDQSLSIRNKPINSRGRAILIPPAADAESAARSPTIIIIQFLTSAKASMYFRI